VTGAVYQIGALRALEELLGRSALDFDIYVGVSGGAFVASLLAHGISPREMYEEATAQAHTPLGIDGSDLYRLDLEELLGRTARAPRILFDALREAITGRPGDSSPFELLPAGLMANSGVREYLEKRFAARGHNDRFEDLARELYVIAVDLDRGEPIAFGEPSHRDLPVSLAVQASTALPGLYQPVRIGGRDYVDGGVQKTAHINRAIQHGADLIICINPIVPILNDPDNGPLGGHLAKRGMTHVLDQVFRIMLHARMEYGMERYAQEHPEIDIILIEPQRSDMKMFRYNIMQLGARRVVAEYGYRSAIAQAHARKEELRRILRRHGLKLADLATVAASPPPESFASPVARELSGSLGTLSAKLALQPEDD
jgi:predicted acylesterase/phospholipase RssA